MAAWNPDRLKNRQRDGIMKLHLRGLITATEAADMIGVTWFTISRAAPQEFVWRAARRRYLDRLAKRYRDRDP